MAIQYVSREVQKNILDLRSKYLDGKLENEVATSEIVSAAVEFIRRGLSEGKLGIELVGEVQGKPMINFIKV